MCRPNRGKRETVTIKNKIEKYVYISVMITNEGIKSEEVQNKIWTIEKNVIMEL